MSGDARQWRKTVDFFDQEGNHAHLHDSRMEAIMKTPRKLLLVTAVGALLGAGAAEVIHAQANTAPAVLIAEIKVNDADGYKAYLAKVSPVTDAFGGRFIVRGGKTESIEGTEPAGRVAVIQFRSMDELKRYWNSPAYQEISPIRQKTATSSIYFVEGVAP
jgi:uncharacterized protein (DUF1330 family)